MADTRISELAVRTAVADSDVLPIVGAGGATQRVRVDRLSRRIQAVSTAAQALTANTNTIPAGASVQLPVAPNIGTTIQWKAILRKTAAGTAGLIGVIRTGTAGTTADSTALASLNFNASTAAADLGRLDVLLSFRDVGASTGVWVVSATLTHSLASTGLLNVPAQTVVNTSGTFNATLPSYYFSLQLNSGTGVTMTVEQCITEALNV